MTWKNKLDPNYQDSSQPLQDSPQPLAVGDHVVSINKPEYEYEIIRISSSGWTCDAKTVRNLISSSKVFDGEVFKNVDTTILKKV